MDNYPIKEQSKYIKEKNKGGTALLLTGLGLAVAFVPFALTALWSLEVYRKMREVLKDE